MQQKPFLGSEAVTAGVVSRYELRRYHRAMLPDVYLDKRVEPSLRQRAVGAWLWSRRRAVIAGLAASALHGSKYIDDDVPVEMIWRNGRPPAGVIVRADLLLDSEHQRFGELTVTTPERTAFDLGRRGGLVTAVQRLDALVRATDIKVATVEELARGHHKARGLRQLETALDLVDHGAESPQETWLRLLLIRAGYPRPTTQIPVVSADGCRRYRLDMGWGGDIKIAVEYDGDQHRTDRNTWAYEVVRAEDIRELGWLTVRATARTPGADVLRRVHRAWVARTRS